MIPWYPEQSFNTDISPHPLINKLSVKSLRSCQSILRLIPPGIRNIIMALCLHQYNYNCVHHSNCGESPVNIIMMSSHYTEWYEELFLRLHQQKITLTCNCSIWPFLVWMSSIAEASGQGKQTHPCQVLRSSGKDGATDSVWREEHEWLSACTKASLCCFSSSPLTNTPITSNINSKIIGLCSGAHS